MREDALWRCPRCGRSFANRNQTHTCRALHDLDHHLEGREPTVRVLYDLVAATVRSIGSVTILPEKTRITFQVRMSFAQVTPRNRWLDRHVVRATAARRGMVRIDSDPEVPSEATSNQHSQPAGTPPFTVPNRRYTTT